MKRQWGIILSLVFALIIAVFSVVNVSDVEVNYVFGRAQWPLILVILGSVLMGALLVGSFGLVRMYRLQRMIHRLKKERETYENKNNELVSVTQSEEALMPGNETEEPKDNKPSI